MMTEAELRDRVEKLRANHADCETAHGEEDDIYKDVLHAIARGEAYPDAATLASIALEVSDFGFDGWYA